MPKKFNYGQIPKNRCRQVLTVLLKFANEDIGEDAAPTLKRLGKQGLKAAWSNWDSSEPELEIWCTAQLIQDLLVIAHPKGKLPTNTQIGYILNHYLGKDYLGILTHHLKPGKGKTKRHFTLKLWSLELAENLRQFDQAWDASHPKVFKVEDSERLSEEITQPYSNNIRYRGTTTFVGRERHFEELHRQLQLKNQVAITAVSGMGGIGKTELALQYANHQLHASNYLGGICWFEIRGKDLANQILAYVQIYLNIDIQENLKLEQKIEKCWAQWQPAEGDVLIILDNVIEYKDIELYLPPPGNNRFRILLTTRLQNIAVNKVHEIRLNELSETAALELLSNLCGRQRVEREKEAAQEVCNRLGYLPLALELVGRFLSRKPDKEEWNFRRVLDELQSKNLRAKILNEPVPGMTKESGILFILELTWNDLTSDAKYLVGFLCVFFISPIPWAVVNNLDLDFERMDLEEVRDEELIKKSLLKRYEVSNEILPFQSVSYQLHEILQDFFASKLDFIQRRRNHYMVMTAWLEIFPREITELVEGSANLEWPFFPEGYDNLLLSRNESLADLTHLECLINAFKHARESKDIRYWPALLFVVDRFLFRWGDIVELKGYIEEVTNDERDLPIAPQLLIRQAILLSEQNRKDESLIILERLFHQKYNSFTDKENRRVQAVVNLTRGTVLLKFPGNSRDAIQYLETALQLYEEFDDEAKGVSRTAAMLGEAYLQLREYREAERSFLKAFETTRNPLYQSLNLRLLGKVNLSNENWSLAFSYFNSGKNLYEHFSLKSKLDSSLDYARFRVDLVEAALLMSINDIYLLEDLIREIRLAINFFKRNNYQDYLQKAKDFEQALIGISLGRESTD